MNGRLLGRVGVGIGAGALMAGMLSTTASAATTTVRWSAPFAADVRVNGVDLGGGRVYVGFETAGGAGGVRAFDPATGATLWNRNLPLAVTATPDFAASANRLYVGTAERIYALNPANGSTILSQPIDGFDEPLGKVEAADGRVYVETLHDIFGFNAALVQQWDYFLDDDPSLMDAPGDGFIYVNDEDETANDFPQCMEKVDGATGKQVARNCKVADFIPPTAVPSKNSVVGVGVAGVFNFRPKNLSVKWLNTTLPDLTTSTATPEQGGRVVAAGGRTYALLRLSDGHQICRATLPAGTGIEFVKPELAPASAAAYVFDGATQSVIKMSASCTEEWRFATSAPVGDLKATTATVYVVTPTRLFALKA
jgi:outer membrane protein assembly factor BamB